MDRGLVKIRYPRLVYLLRPLWRIVHRASDVRKLFPKLTWRIAFKRSFRILVQKAKETDDKRFVITIRERLPIRGDDSGVSVFDAHYVFHTSWAARLLQKNRPPEHHDFGSDIRFATIVSAFMPVYFYDYRPLLIDLTGLKSLWADLTAIKLPSESLWSLSCMHVVEHVGLGRYGDLIDPLGDIKAMRELLRILAPGGDLYFVVPVGSPKLRFNAHRIYSFAMIREYFEELLLEDFSLVKDDGSFISGATEQDANRQAYGCGCFWFHKAPRKG